MNVKYPWSTFGVHYVYQPRPLVVIHYPNHPAQSLRRRHHSSIGGPFTTVTLVQFTHISTSAALFSPQHLTMFLHCFPLAALVIAPTFPTLTFASKPSHLAQRGPADVHCLQV
jgi:hypothetical protein